MPPMRFTWSHDVWPLHPNNSVIIYLIDFLTDCRIHNGGQNMEDFLMQVKYNVKKMKVGFSQGESIFLKNEWLISLKNRVWKLFLCMDPLPRNTMFLNAYLQKSLDENKTFKVSLKCFRYALLSLSWTWNFLIL